MKAIVHEGFGSPDILRCKDIEKPTLGENEVSIKVCAASISPLDWKLMKGDPVPRSHTAGVRQTKDQKARC